MIIFECSKLFGYTCLCQWYVQHIKWLHTTQTIVHYTNGGFKLLIYRFVNPNMGFSYTLELVFIPLSTGKYVFGLTNHQINELSPYKQQNQTEVNMSFDLLIRRKYLRSLIIETVDYRPCFPIHILHVHLFQWVLSQIAVGEIVSFTLVCLLGDGPFIFAYKDEMMHQSIYTCPLGKVYGKKQGEKSIRLFCILEHSNKYLDWFLVLGTQSIHFMLTY